MVQYLRYRWVLIVTIFPIVGRYFHQIFYDFSTFSGRWEDLESHNCDILVKK